MVILGLVAVLLSGCQIPEPTDQSSSVDVNLVELSESDIQVGKGLFNQQCARCHGVQADGGNGPSLKRVDLINAPTDEALVNVIQFGIPGTEMPGNWMLSEKDAIQVAGYVRSLGQLKQASFTGNIELGKKLFDGKGACKACHMVSGEGNSIGPELTNVGNRRGPEYLHTVLLEPGFYKKEGELPKTASGFIDHLVYSITDNAGNELEAMRINEDAFTIQLRDAHNKYYSFRKSDLSSLTKEFGKSIMPSIKGLFSDSEIEDLVAYLINLKQSTDS